MSLTLRLTVCIVTVFTYRLVDTLEAHLDQYSLPQLPDLHQLPADITIGQAVSTWKHIVIYQHKKKTNTTQHLY